MRQAEVFDKRQFKADLKRVLECWQWSTEDFAKEAKIHPSTLHRFWSENSSHSNNLTLALACRIALVADLDLNKYIIDNRKKRIV